MGKRGDRLPEAEWKVWFQCSIPIEAGNGKHVQEDCDELKKSEVGETGNHIEVQDHGVVFDRPDNEGDKEGYPENEIGKWPRQRHQRLVSFAWYRSTIDPHGSTRQSDSPDRKKGERNDNAEYGVRVLERIEREVSPGDNTVVSASVGNIRMRKFVEAQGDEPSNEDDQKDLDPLRSDGPGRDPPPGNDPNPKGNEAKKDRMGASKPRKIVSDR